MKGQLRIDQMFAVIATDRDGTEGLLAFQSPMGVLGISAKVVRFSQREELQTIGPSLPPDKVV